MSLQLTPGWRCKNFMQVILDGRIFEMSLWSWSRGDLFLITIHTTFMINCFFSHIPEWSVGWVAGKLFFFFFFSPLCPLISSRLSMSHTTSTNNRRFHSEGTWNQLHSLFWRETQTLCDYMRAKLNSSEWKWVTDLTNLYRRSETKHLIKNPLAPVNERWTV